MNIWFLRLVRFECALIAVYHILIGTAATLAPVGAIDLASAMYGISFDVFAPMKSEYFIVIRFMGAFAFTFGLLMALAAWRPHQNWNIILCASIFFLVRIVDRILGADILISTFKSTSLQNLGHILMMASFVVIFWLFAIYRYRMPANASTS